MAGGWVSAPGSDTGIVSLELPHGGMEIPEDGALVVRIKRQVAIASDEG